MGKGARGPAERRAGGSQGSCCPVKEAVLQRPRPDQEASHHRLLPPPPRRSLQALPCRSAPLDPAGGGGLAHLWEPLPPAPAAPRTPCGVLSPKRLSGWALLPPDPHSHLQPPRPPPRPPSFHIPGAPQRRRSLKPCKREAAGPRPARPLPQQSVTVPGCAHSSPCRGRRSHLCPPSVRSPLGTGRAFRKAEPTGTRGGPSLSRAFQRRRLLSARSESAARPPWRNVQFLPVLFFSPLVAPGLTGCPHRRALCLQPVSYAPPSPREPLGAQADSQCSPCSGRSPWKVVKHGALTPGGGRPSLWTSSPRRAGAGAWCLVRFPLRSVQGPNL